MKKTISISTSFLLIVQPVLFSVSCSGREVNIDNDLSDQIIALNSLKSNSLKSNDITVNYNMDTDKFIQAVDLLSNLTANVKTQLKANIATIGIANQLLFDISRKIDGFSWIFSKMRWQASKFTIDKMSANQAINIISGWMDNTTDFSVSISFLTDKKEGWTPIGNIDETNGPRYARINLNKKVVFSGNDFKVDKSLSNMDCIHPNDGQSVDDVTYRDIYFDEEYGSIYQGLYYSSTLLDLDGIFKVPKEKILPSNFLDYALNAFDWINNGIQSGAFNNILNFFQDVINDWITTYFNENPIYLSEDDPKSKSAEKSYSDSDQLFKGKQIKSRLSNQIIHMIFMLSLARNHFIDGYLGDADATKKMKSDMSSDAQLISFEMYSTLESIFDSEKNKNNPYAKIPEIIALKNQPITYSEHAISFLQNSDMFNNADDTSIVGKKSGDQCIWDTGTIVTIDWFLDNFLKISDDESVDKFSLNEVACFVSMYDAIVEASILAHKNAMNTGIVNDPLEIPEIDFNKSVNLDITPYAELSNAQPNDSNKIAIDDNYDSSDNDGWRYISTDRIVTDPGSKNTKFEMDYGIDNEKDNEGNVINKASFTDDITKSIFKNYYSNNILSSFNDNAESKISNDMKNYIKDENSLNSVNGIPYKNLYSDYKEDVLDPDKATMEFIDDYCYILNETLAPIIEDILNPQSSNISYIDDDYDEQNYMTNNFLSPIILGDNDTGYNNIKTVLNYYSGVNQDVQPSLINVYIMHGLRDSYYTNLSNEVKSDWPQDDNYYGDGLLINL